jgi:phage shock protein A
MQYMNDLFKKINTLVSATINEVLGDNPAQRGTVSPQRLGKDVDREIAALRQKVNEALEHETHLQQQLVTLQDEIARWDKQADEAVARGGDDAARYAISQMQHAERRYAIADSGLNEHRLVTQDLIQKVNMLEAAVADARRQQSEQAHQNQPPAPNAAEERSPLRVMSDVLRDTREKITQMSELISAKEEVAGTPAPPTTDAHQQTVNDDFERRRQRLSK